ncbi:MAG TPA: tetratricopeptide repeat protein [Aestuariivirgaceae bacterium]|nr:tetratricopeptide repeat protein [Aestuariivirgaceae bacterium]
MAIAYLVAPSPLSPARAQTPQLDSLDRQIEDHFRAANYGKALDVAEKYRKLVEETYGTGGLWYAVALNNLAIIYTAQGRFGKAEPLYQRALAIREKRHGPEHPDVAKTLNELAALYQDLVD